MGFVDEIQTLLETEELETVGDAFGGHKEKSRKNYSIAAVRDWMLSQAPFDGSSELEKALKRTYDSVPMPLFRILLSNSIRFSFLIELTNLKVGSTKMKTRWLPGKILMPQKDSFEPFQGTFQPGNDPRSQSFEECVQICINVLTLFCNQLETEASLEPLLIDLENYHRVTYESPIAYRDTSLIPVHQPSNVCWALTDDLNWLIKARPLLRSASGTAAQAIREIEKNKLEVKVFKTDRALTGKDKTNRAKRWEILVGDFQYATMEQCWSAERKLIAALVCFHDFPAGVRASFVGAGLMPNEFEPTLCPITLEPLSFNHLSTQVLNATHGTAEYQIGHLNPLKRGGRHDGTNVCWQSENGNRIQGHLSVDETHDLIIAIASRITHRE